MALESIDEYKHIIVLGGLVFAIVVLSGALSKQLPLTGELFGFKATYIYILIIAITAVVFWNFYFPKAEPKRVRSYAPPQPPIQPAIPVQIYPPIINQQYIPPIQPEPIQPITREIKPIQPPRREQARPVFPDEPLSK